MNIYELHLKSHPRSYLDYFDGFVVVAPSARVARRMASRPYDQDRVSAQEFLDPKLTTCHKMGETTRRTEPGIVLASFNAG